MMNNKRIAWINCAKFIAMLAVFIDHTSGQLYINYALVLLSLFSTSLFILLSGQTIYISLQNHPLKWFKTFIRLSKRVILSYSFSVFVYFICIYRFFDINEYLRFLLHFNISGPHYYVLLYLQLMVVSKALWHVINFCRGKYEIVWEVLLLIPIILISYLTTNYTNIFNLWGGGGKLLGGTYLILFYIGMLLQKNYHYWGEKKSIIKSTVISGVSVILAIAWWRFECMDNFQIDSLLPFGTGFNPPSITSITMAIIMIFVSYGIFTLLEQCRYTRFIVSFVSWLGGYTMYIFLYHRLFLDYVLINITFSNIWFKRLVYWCIMAAGPILIAILLKMVKKYCYEIATYNNSKIMVNTTHTGRKNMKIMPNRLDKGFFLYQEELEQKALEVLRSGWYVLGEEVSFFEREFASYTGSKYCVGLASGLDALWIAFRILGIGTGDEVIVQGNTYIASVMGITINGATPIFVEPDEYYNIDTSKIEEKITKHTKAILVVHLYGQASNMSSIMDIARKYELRVVEDCAQSHGACFDGKMTGTFGDIGCFSFYPSKNLGAFGDAGAIITNNAEIAKNVRIFRNYGSEKRYYNQMVGTNSRLDELQAGLLRVKLSHIKELEDDKRKICNRYLRELKHPDIILPKIRKDATHIWHQFVIRTERRQELINYLNDKEIGTIIHYPIPPHLSEAYKYLNIGTGSLPITEHYAKSVLSIPLYNGMSEEEQDYVIKMINAF